MDSDLYSAFKTAHAGASALESPDLTAALHAAHAGAEIVLKYWNTPKEYETKADSHFDLVSFVDQAADSAIHQVLQTLCPADSILSEEISPDTLVSEGRTWIVDPLDGTSSYLFKTDPSAPSVMIALMVNGACSVSVVCQPMLNRWTYAVAKKGTFQCQANEAPERMLIPNGPKLSTAWIDMNHYGGIEFESSLFRRIDTVVRSNGGARLVSRSVPHSAIALRLLVSHSLLSDSTPVLGACVHDHNPLKPKQLPWDIVPIQLIVQEAGGVYLDIARGAIVDPFALSGPILVASSSLADEIRSRIIK